LVDFVLLEGEVVVFGGKEEWGAEGLPAGLEELVDLVFQFVNGSSEEFVFVNMHGDIRGCEGNAHERRKVF
jgi:hypothetical protein